MRFLLDRLALALVLLLLIWPSDSLPTGRTDLTWLINTLKQTSEDAKDKLNAAHEDMVTVTMKHGNRNGNLHEKDNDPYKINAIDDFYEDNEKLLKHPYTLKEEVPKEIGKAARNGFLAYYKEHFGEVHGPTTAADAAAASRKRVEKYLNHVAWNQASALQFSHILAREASRLGWIPESPELDLILPAAREANLGFSPLRPLPALQDAMDNPYDKAYGTFLNLLVRFARAYRRAATLKRGRGEPIGFTVPQVYLGLQAHLPQRGTKEQYYAGIGNELAALTSGRPIPRLLPDPYDLSRVVYDRDPEAARSGTSYADYFRNEGYPDEHDPRFSDLFRTFDLEEKSKEDGHQPLRSSSSRDRASRDRPSRDRPSKDRRRHRANRNPDPTPPHRDYETGRPLRSAASNPARRLDPASWQSDPQRYEAGPSATYAGPSAPGPSFRPGSPMQLDSPDNSEWSSRPNSATPPHGGSEDEAGSEGWPTWIPAAQPSSYASHGAGSGVEYDSGWSGHQGQGSGGYGYGQGQQGGWTQGYDQQMDGWHGSFGGYQ